MMSRPSDADNLETIVLPWTEENARRAVDHLRRQYELARARRNRLSDPDFWLKFSMVCLAISCAQLVLWIVLVAVDA